MGELTQGCALTGLGHARQAEIDAGGQDHGQERVAVIRHATGAAMGEAFGKAGPAIDLQKKIGDLHAWQPIIGDAAHIFCARRRDCLERRYDQAVAVKAHLGQLSLPGEDRHPLDHGV